MGAVESFSNVFNRLCVAAFGSPQADFSRKSENSGSGEPRQRGFRQRICRAHYARHEHHFSTSGFFLKRAFHTRTRSSRHGRRKRCCSGPRHCLTMCVKSFLNRSRVICALVLWTSMRSLVGNWTYHSRRWDKAPSNIVFRRPVASKITLCHTPTNRVLKHTGLCWQDRRPELSRISLCECVQPKLKPSTSSRVLVALNKRSAFVSPQNNPSEMSSFLLSRRSSVVKSTTDELSSKDCMKMIEGASEDNSQSGKTVFLDFETEATTELQVAAVQSAAVDFDLLPHLAVPAEARLDDARVNDFVAMIDSQISHLKAIIADLKLISQLGELPVSVVNPSKIRVHLHNCDVDRADRLMREKGVSRGRIVEERRLTDVANAIPPAYISWISRDKTPGLSFTESTLSVSSLD